MKYISGVSAILSIIIIVVIINSCKKDNDEPLIKKTLLTGYVQKGPYINGTSIEMFELNSKLEQTGKVFSTQINNNKGSFEINNIALSSQFVEFSADGYYFNEITGDLSPSPLSLFALSDIKDISTVNVNILTHLEKGRVEYLVSKGKSFTTAKDSAQKSVLAIFGFQADSIDQSEMLDISINKKENAVLLAISIIVQGKRMVGDLTELLANITTDIQQDGKLNDEGILSNLRTSTLLLDLVKIRSNLEKRYQELGISATIPGFEKYVNDFLAFTGQKPTSSTQAATVITTTSAQLNGSVNANDLSTTVTFEYGTTNDYGSSVTATQSPVTGHTNTTVNSTISGLNPGTLYHFRVKSVNSQGTVYGNDLTFTTLGQVSTATTLAATNITITSATLNGTVNANYLSTNVTFEFGITTSYGQTVTATQSPVTGSTNTSVSANISGLTEGTTFHFRVKAVNSLGTTYGNDLTFKTSGSAPTVTTQAATNITTTGAILKGTVNANYLLTIVSFEYGTTTSYGQTVTAAQNPVTGSTSTSVSANLSGLTEGTTYHYRVKAVNSLGTSYGNDLTFKTSGSAPTVTTQAASNITTTGATLNGTVNANYFSSKVSFEYGETTSYRDTIIVIQSPVTGNTNTNVSANISGLTAGTTYHFRVKAVNSLGTAYGNDMLFTTVPVTVNDVDGNTYKVVAIGSQIWMAENLKTSKYNDGTAVPLLTDATAWSNLTKPPSYCWYSNNEATYKNIYGALYNWYTVNTGKLCPSGWHVPTNAEWITLTTYLGGESIAGGKLKETGISHWKSPNIDATNVSGFTGLPGGLRFYDGSFSEIANYGYWWSSTETSTYTANNRILYYYSGDVTQNTSTIYNKQSGFSVRCLRDN